MRVMELTDWNAESIKLGQREKPGCGDDEVLIRMQAASLNYRDTILVKKGYGRLSGTLPLIPVSDGAGIIEQIGADVEEFSVGNLVTPFFFQDWPDGPYSTAITASAMGGMRDGVMQEYMSLPARLVAKAPDHFNALQASTLPCAALTAWNAIVASGNVKNGDVVIIQGTGGVSLFALQFARMRGAKTIVLSSTDEKLAHCKKLGADHLINYTVKPEWSQDIREITGGLGASHVVEVGGARTLEQSIRSIAAGGTISLIGVLSGLKPELNLGPVVTQNIRLQGITVGSHAMHRDMVAAIEEHQILPVTDDHVEDFGSVGTAIAAFDKAGHFGKVCIDFSK